MKILVNYFLRFLDNFLEIVSGQRTICLGIDNNERNWAVSFFELLGTGFDFLGRNLKLGEL
ncbi:hypothetical protein KQI36_15540 [Clostridium senegalense]|uniref:hypothetical protein n=1 Tax=Clostridium senegalense TaxID=1465809 RepID=UPI001C10CAB3|nr:hypothetical protein [Clostridium senegalense]MBU5228044.1 hypothetical protein [Clostridium senegalense]